MVRTFEVEEKMFKLGIFITKASFPWSRAALWRLIVVCESIYSHNLGQVNISAPATYFILPVYKNKKMKNKSSERLSVSCESKLEGRGNVQR